ncbi:hypothetical protein MNBD_GAMMA26-1993 [hydrothermal vent metagenome]|uniref:Lipopolysaccharide assembly protein A domain-containing protein n=1 Tax=hydrothermal vent metagenome TaxID=652676 RepID=A0A3B1B4M8_9ZZZZ
MRNSYKNQEAVRVRFVKLIIVLLVMMLGVVVAVTNPGSISLNYVLGIAEIPLSIVLVVALSLGALLGIIVSLGVLLRLKHENSKLQRKAQLTTVEVNNLRAIPLKDQ